MVQRSDGPYVDDINATLESLRMPLRVLVWGPGETSNTEWFSKRQLVIDNLRDASKGQDEVFTSEELIRQQNSSSVLDPGYIELVHAQLADVIIAIVLASPDRQGGVYRELEILAQHEHLRQKVTIFLPAQKKWQQRFQAGMLNIYRTTQIFELPWNVIKDCEQLRSISSARVEEERKQRMYRKLIASIRSGDV